MPAALPVFFERVETHKRSARPKNSANRTSTLDFDQALIELMRMKIAAHVCEIHAVSVRRAPSLAIKRNFQSICLFVLQWCVDLTFSARLRELLVCTEDEINELSRFATQHANLIYFKDGLAKQRLRLVLRKVAADDQAVSENDLRQATDKRIFRILISELDAAVGKTNWRAAFPDQDSVLRLM
ncbi:MAG: hypothetical protein AAFX08_09545 [Pseudomonadota bacterium]